jgi:hypothetical protein
MIRHAPAGTHVVAWYARPRATLMPHHGKRGTVIRSARGPGPRNVAVRFGERVVIIPAGNLKREGTR